MTTDPGGDRFLDVPFEPQRSTPLGTATLVASGVVVMATVVDDPVEGPIPCLTFRFADGAGGFHPAMTLLMVGRTPDLLPALVTDAVHRAVEGAAAARNGG